MQARSLLLASFAAATLGIIGNAVAQDYPSRPIMMILDSAGGTPDTIARILAERMRASLAQSIIVENVGGAAGSIAAGRAARAAADGYTLSVGTVSTHVINGAVYALPYDVLNDFDPVALLPSLPLLIVASKALPANDLKGLVTWLKANPGKASQGYAGTTSQVAGLFFQNTTGTRFQLVPYRGFASAVQGLMAGNIDLMFTPASTALGLVQGGQIKAFAVTAKNRLAVAPDIPTIDEAGLPGFYMSVWQALWAPKGTPKPIIAKLNAAVVEALADPAVRSRITALAQEIPPRDQQTPEALGAFQKAEIEKWWPIIRAANIKVE